MYQNCRKYVGKQTVTNEQTVTDEKKLDIKGCVDK